VGDDQDFVGERLNLVVDVFLNFKPVDNQAGLILEDLELLI